LLKDNKTGLCKTYAKDSFIENCYHNLKEELKKTKEKKEELFNELQAFSGSTKNKTSGVLFEYIQENLLTSVAGLGFRPVEQELITYKKEVYLNDYTAPKYLKKSFNNGNKDSNVFPNIKELILNLCGSDTLQYKYILKVLAHTILHPEKKRQGYVVFQGDPGAGKGSFYEFILKGIFEEYCYTGNEQTIFRNKFSSEIAKSLWVMCEEKTDDIAKRQGSIGSQIKEFTGSTEFRSEEKGVNAQIVESFHNLVFNTNEINPGLGLASDDRRASVLGWSRTLGGSKDKATSYYWKYKKVIPPELDDFVSYLKNLDYEIQEINTNYVTNSFRSLISLDRTNTEKFMESLKDFWSDENSNWSNYKNFLPLFDDSIFFIPTTTNVQNIPTTMTKENESSIYISYTGFYKMFCEYCKHFKFYQTSTNNFSAEVSKMFGHVQTKRKWLDKNNYIKTYNIVDFRTFFEFTIDKEKTAVKIEVLN
jgi:phage/plasmid-associated DNA primase